MTNSAIVVDFSSEKAQKMRFTPFEVHQLDLKLTQSQKLDFVNLKVTFCCEHLVDPGVEIVNRHICKVFCVSE